MPGSVTGLGELFEDLAGDGAFEDPEDLGVERPASRWRGTKVRVAVASHPDHGDGVQRLFAPGRRPREPVAGGLARGRRDRGGATQRGEGGFGVQPVGVAAGGDEQLGGGVRADAVELKQVGLQLGEIGVMAFEVVDLGASGIGAAGPGPSARSGPPARPGPGAGRSAAGQGLDQRAFPIAAVLLAHRNRRGDQRWWIWSCAVRALTAERRALAVRESVDALVFAARPARPDNTARAAW